MGALDATRCRGYVDELRDVVHEHRPVVLAGAGQPGAQEQSLMRLPDRTVERLSAYRRLLTDLVADGQERVYSHDLAALEGLTPAQVRRDLMTIGFQGSPAKGYDVPRLLATIEDLILPQSDEGMALVGVGHLGTALLAYFNGQRSHLSIIAAFDTDPSIHGRVIHGCPCHPVEDIPAVVADRKIAVAVVAVPAPTAQEVVDRLVHAGVGGLLNFAPVRLQVPAAVYVEDIHITVSLEKVAYFARVRKEKQEAQA